MRQVDIIIIVIFIMAMILSSLSTLSLILFDLALLFVHRQVCRWPNLQLLLLLLLLLLSPPPPPLMMVKARCFPSLIDRLSSVCALLMKQRPSRLAPESCRHSRTRMRVQKPESQSAASRFDDDGGGGGGGWSS